MLIFENRQEAGKELAKSLPSYRDKKDTVIMALPRGGVPVAYEVAKALHLPLDVLIVRKLGVPFNRELAIGALAMGGITIIDQTMVTSFGVSRLEIEDVIEKEKQELNRRNDLYREGRDFPDVHSKTVILIDDGIATGSTMKAAIWALKEHHPHKIIVAVPVGPETIYDDFGQIADDVICLGTPSYFYAVGQVYKQFSQTSDAEVLEFLKQAGKNFI